MNFAFRFSRREFPSPLLHSFPLLQKMSYRSNGYKRKRNGNNGPPAKRYRARAAPQDAPVPVQYAGTFRQSGYYGRYNQPGDQGAELKFHDLDINDAVVAQNGTIAEDSCNAIAQGVTEVQRIGRKCIIRSINWRFELSMPGAANIAAGADTVRVILYQDKQANGATATVTGILESDDFQSFNNLANKSRFHTLMDRQYSLQSWGGSNAASEEIGPIQVQDTLFKKCNIPIEFDSTTGAITEVRSNNIGVLLLGRGGVMGFASKMRLRFSDN